MPPNEPKEPPSLTALSSDSDSWEARVRKEIDFLLESQTAVAALQEDVRRAWTRLAQLTRLEEKRTEHVLKLATAVEQDKNSRDRQTEALQECLRALTEGRGDVEYIRAGIDAILKAVAKKKPPLPATPSPADGGSGKFGVVVSTINVFVRAPLRSQVMLVLLVAAAVFSYLMYRQGAQWEAPQGAPLEERDQRQPHFRHREAPPVDFAAPALPVAAPSPK